MPESLEREYTCTNLNRLGCHVLMYVVRMIFSYVYYTANHIFGVTTVSGFDLVE